MATSNIKAKKKVPYLSEGLKILLAVILGVAVLMPLLVMLLSITPESLEKVFVGNGGLGGVIKRTLISTTVSTVLTILLAYGMAVATQRCQIACQGLFALMFTLPMLVPSISHAVGLQIFIGNNGSGLFPRFVNGLLGENVVTFSIHGFWGIVIGSMLYAFPVAYLMFADILRYEDRTPYEAAKVMGISKWRQFTAITWPYLRRPLISVVFAVFSLIVTDYGVPTRIGSDYSTLAKVMIGTFSSYSATRLQECAVYGMLLMVPALIAFLFDLFNKDKGNSAYVIKQEQQPVSKVSKGLAYVGCILTSIFILIPIVSFVVAAFVKTFPVDMTFTWAHLADVLQVEISRALGNSLLIAVVVSVVGTMVAFFTAYFTARMPSASSKFLHLSSIITGALPGLVLGLSYMMTFQNSMIYGTIVILIMANTVHFLSSPYLMMYNSLAKINENLEPVGETLGISRFRMIKDVFLPRCMGTLLEMFSYFFVNCMITISAVKLLKTDENEPLSLLLTKYSDTGSLEKLAIISLLILAVNLAVKGVAWLCKRKAHA